MKEKVLSGKEHIIIFGPIILIILFVAIFFKFEQTSRQDFYDYVIPSQFNGKVIEKYRSYNHAEPKIKYYDKGVIYEMSCYNWKNLYDRIDIGDSIFKISGDTTMFLKKKDNIEPFPIYYVFDEGWGIVRRKW